MYAKELKRRKSLMKKGRREKKKGVYKGKLKV
jgi:hypothetical protein